jgi:hypothetical protein
MEEEDVNQNWDHQEASAQTHSDPGPFNVAGNRVARISGLSHGLSGTGHSRLYCRYYQKFEAGYDFTAACHNGGAWVGGRDCYGCAGNRPPVGTDGWFWGVLESCGPRSLHYYFYSAGMYMDCGHGGNPDACWGDHFPCKQGEFCGPGGSNTEHTAPPLPTPPQINEDQWYCVEMMADVGDPTPSLTGANAMLDFWIDGVQYGPFENLWFRSVPDPDVLLNKIGFMMYYHDGNPNGRTFLIDDVVVSKQPIGCAGRVDSVPSLVTDVMPWPGPAEPQHMSFRAYPVKGGIILKYSVPFPARVRMGVWNHKGVRVAILADRYMQPGEYTAEWRDKHGSHIELSTGLYLIRIDINGSAITGRAALIR